MIQFLFATSAPPYLIICESSSPPSPKKLTLSLSRCWRGDIKQTLRSSSSISTSMEEVGKAVLGASLCSEGPIFRRSYVPSFSGKARNIGSSEHRTFNARTAPLFRIVKPKIKRKRFFLFSSPLKF